MPKTKALTDEHATLLRERAEILQFLAQVKAIHAERVERLNYINAYLEGAKIPLDTEPPPAPAPAPVNRAEARRAERAAKRAADAAAKAARAKAANKPAKKAPAKKATKRTGARAGRVAS